MDNKKQLPIESSQTNYLMSIMKQSKPDIANFLLDQAVCSLTRKL
jgi:hypothetical protein